MEQITRRHQTAATTQDGDLRERPVGELVKELSEQTSRLVRQELELARVELIEKGKVQQATPPAPRQAIDSVKEDVRWTKQRAQAGRS